MSQSKQRYYRWKGHLSTTGPRQYCSGEITSLKEAVSTSFLMAVAISTPNKLTFSLFEIAEAPETHTNYVNMTLRNAERWRSHGSYEFPLKCIRNKGQLCAWACAVWRLKECVAHWGVFSRILMKPQGSAKGQQEGKIERGGITAQNEQNVHTYMYIY